MRAVSNLMRASVAADSLAVTSWSQAVDPEVLLDGSPDESPALANHPPGALRHRLQIDLALGNPAFKAIMGDDGVPGSTAARAVSLFIHEGDARSPSLLAFSLGRNPDRPGFSEREIARLIRHHVEIERAARRVKRLETESSLHRGLERVVRDLTTGVVLANRNCEVYFDNRLSAETNGDKDTLPKLPREITSICEDLRKVWSASGRSQSSNRRKRLVSMGAEVTVELIAPNPAERGGPVFLIKFQSGVPSGGNLGAGSSNPFLLHQLSPREKEIARLVTAGLSNSDIANSLGRSVATVKTTLHAIFGKLDVTSRSQLVILLHG